MNVNCICLNCTLYFPVYALCVQGLGDGGLMVGNGRWYCLNCKMYLFECYLYLPTLKVVFLSLYFRRARVWRWWPGDRLQVMVSGNCLDFKMYLVEC